MINNKSFISSARSYLSYGYTVRELAAKLFVYKVISKLKTILFHKFSNIGINTIIDYRVQVDGSNFISLGSNVIIQKNSWLVIPLFELKKRPASPIMLIGDGVRIGQGCTIAAANFINIEDDVLFGPNVMVLDHVHEFKNPILPIAKQGIRIRGSVTIKSGAWIGTNVVIVPQNGDLVIGRNAVIGANSVVNSSVNDFSIVCGNPAKSINSN